MNQTAQSCHDPRCQREEGHKGPHGADVGKGDYAEWTEEISEMVRGR